MKKKIVFKRLPAFIYAFLITTSTSIAQGHWKEITLFTTHGDSIQGLVSYKNKFKAFKFLPVKDKNTGTIKIYTPATIKSFTIRLNDQKIYFKSLITQADYSSDEADKLSNSPELELTKDTVFAQSLVQGKRNLYYYVDNNVFKKHFLIETEKDHAADLINKSYYTDASRMIVGYNRQYLSQLRSFLSESTTIAKERINETPFQKKELVKIVKDYNIAAASTTTTPLYEYKEEKAALKFGIIAGANITSILLKGGYHFDQLKFNSSTGANIGVALNLIFPGTRKRLSLYNELLYSSYKSTSSGFYEYYENAQWYRELKSASIEASYLKLFTSLRYQSTNRFAPFIQLGIVNGYAIHHTTTAEREIRFYSTTSIENTPLIDDFRSYEQSLFGGIGFHFKKVGLEIRYERGNGMSKMSGVNSTVNYLYFLLNYTF